MLIFLATRMSQKILSSVVFRRGRIGFNGWDIRWPGIMREPGIMRHPMIMLPWDLSNDKIWWGFGRKCKKLSVPFQRSENRMTYLGLCSKSSTQVPLSSCIVPTAGLDKMCLDPRCSKLIKDDTVLLFRGVRIEFMSKSLLTLKHSSK